MLHKIASDIILDKAYEWLCGKRKDYSHNNDVWPLRRDWDIVKPDLQVRLLTGEYQFCPLDEIRLPDSIIELWRSEDALILKDHLNPVLSARCFHVEGNGGRAGAVKETIANMYDPENRISL